MHYKDWKDTLTTDQLKLYRTRYQQHRDNTRRGRVDKAGNTIEFRLTLDQWLEIWWASGHLGERGCQKGGYVMTRFGDLGHYEVGNVEIRDSSWNCQQANKGRTFTSEHKQKLSLAKKGRPSGRVHSPETRQKMSQSHLKRTRANFDRTAPDL